MFVYLYVCVFFICVFVCFVCYEHSCMCVCVFVFHMFVCFCMYIIVWLCMLYVCVTLLRGAVRNNPHFWWKAGCLQCLVHVCLESCKLATLCCPLDGLGALDLEGVTQKHRFVNPGLVGKQKTRVLWALSSERMNTEKWSKRPETTLSQRVTDANSQPPWHPRRSLPPWGFELSLSGLSFQPKDSLHRSGQIYWWTPAASAQPNSICIFKGKFSDYEMLGWGFLSIVWKCQASAPAHLIRQQLLGWLWRREISHSLLLLLNCLHAGGLARCACRVLPLLPYLQFATFI